MQEPVWTAVTCLLRSLLRLAWKPVPAPSASLSGKGGVPDCGSRWLWVLLLQPLHPSPQGSIVPSPSNSKCHHHSMYLLETDPPSAPTCHLSLPILPRATPRAGSVPTAPRTPAQLCSVSGPGGVVLPRCMSGFWKAMCSSESCWQPPLCLGRDLRLLDSQS